MRRFLVLSVVLAACGSSDSAGRLADAPPSIDAGIPDAPPPPTAPVTLTIMLDGAPQVGVRVYFLNADDSVVLSATTDATGAASATMAAGGSVTAIDPFAPPAGAARAPRAVQLGDDELRTFAGVKPGDHLVLNATTPGEAQFTMVASAVDGANDYQVYTTCGAGSLNPGGGNGGSGSPDPGGSFDFVGCSATADVAVLARTVGEGVVNISGLYHPNAPIQNDTTLDLTNDPFSDLNSIDFTYMNVPNAGLNVQHFPITGHGLLGPIPVSISESTDDSGVTTGTGTSQEPTVVSTSGVVDTTLNMNAVHDVVDWGPAAASYQLDLNNLLLADLVSSPQFNPTTQKMSWIEAATGAVPDFSAVAMVVRRSTAERSWHWEIVGPYTPGEIRFPQLPTDVFDWRPAVDDSVDTLQLMNAKVPGGYDAARAHSLDLWDADSGSLLQNHAAQLAGFVAGASGKVVVVQIQSQLPELARRRAAAGRR